MTRRLRSRRDSEAGFVAGAEVLPFGVLVFIGAMVLAVNAWSVIQVRMALDAASRDYLRAYTESANYQEGISVGRRAASQSVSARLNGDFDVEIIDPNTAFAPCRLATVELELRVPALNVPFVGEVLETTVRSTQSELIDPYSPNDASEFGLVGTPCE